MEARRCWCRELKSRKWPGRQPWLGFVGGFCRGAGHPYAPPPWKPRADRHADQARAALLLPDRLAADQPWVRFVRAKGCCEACGRPQGQVVRHLGDGRLWDEARQSWRDGSGREIPCPAAAEEQPSRTTKVVLAAAHLDHDPGHCGRRHRNVKALCQRCHLLHDRPEHRRRIRLTLRRRRALGDLFSGTYPA